MASREETHYATLGVPRDARPGEIARAHDRLTEEFRKDTTPPDPRREARVREAFAVLSDESRRAEYDRALDAAPSPGRRPRPLVLAAVAAALLGGVAAAWMARGPAASDRAGRPVQEIQAEVAASIGQVRSLDLAGNATDTGIAFTVAQGVMATTCAGIGPNAQLVVVIGARSVPARLTLADEALGMCKLAVDGAGSWPLPLGAAAPAGGARVYAPAFNAAGEVSLAEGRVAPGGAATPAATIDASVPGGAAIGGRPLLDVQGRVVAVATGPAPGGGVRHRIVPAKWAEDSSPAAAPSSPSGDARPSPVAEPAEGRPATPPLPKPMQDKAEGIAKQLRPPPTVPGNL